MSDIQNRELDHNNTREKKLYQNLFFMKLHDVSNLQLHPANVPNIKELINFFIFNVISQLPEVTAMIVNNFIHTNWAMFK